MGLHIAMKTFLAILCLSGCLLFSETSKGQTGSGRAEVLRFGFYNAENYFDPYVDSASVYHEFDPGGDRHWTVQRYAAKRQHVFKVVAAMGGWQGMDVMAFAEIENRFVLDDLLKNTPLGEKNYGIVHFESPDHRGIDVGLIYKKSAFSPLYSRAIRVYDSTGKLLKTRDILYVKGRVGADTIHLFINHWPSRYGGLMATVSKRLLVSRILLRVVDSVCVHNKNARILIFGDFNEPLSGKGLQHLLRAGKKCGLSALQPHWDFGLTQGTIRGKEGWAIFDRVFCSKNFLSAGEPVLVDDKSFHIFDAPFLLENDKKKLGLKPNRTYAGYAYHGGFSDHLPVYVNVVIKEAGK